MAAPSRVLPFIFLLVIAFAVVVGVFDISPRRAPPSRLIGTTVKYFNLPMLDSDKRFTPDLWKGKAAVIVVFASWCPPCGFEHPIIERLAQEGHVPVYGIDWKDKTQQVHVWLTERGNPYKAVGEDFNGDVGELLDLNGVPETFIVDRDGKIVYNFKAGISEERLNTEVLPLLKKLQGE